MSLSEMMAQLKNTNGAKSALSEGLALSSE